MEFEWTGDPVQDFTGRSVADMQPNILYRQNGIWRLALRPGTDTGLTFVRVVFTEDASTSQSVSREAEAEFARAVGRVIPVQYRAEAIQESTKEQGLIKNLIDRVIG